jgi:hypothetical protein
VRCEGWLDQTSTTAATTTYQARLELHDDPSASELHRSVGKVAEAVAHVVQVKLRAQRSPKTAAVRAALAVRCGEHICPQLGAPRRVVDCGEEVEEPERLPLGADPLQQLVLHVGEEVGGREECVEDERLHRRRHCQLDLRYEGLQPRWRVVAASAPPQRRLYACVCVRPSPTCPCMCMCMCMCMCRACACACACAGHVHVQGMCVYIYTYIHMYICIHTYLLMHDAEDVDVHLGVVELARGAAGAGRAVGAVGIEQQDARGEFALLADVAHLLVALQHGEEGCSTGRRAAARGGGLQHGEEGCRTGRRAAARGGGLQHGEEGCSTGRRAAARGGGLPHGEEGCSTGRGGGGCSTGAGCNTMCQRLQPCVREAAALRVGVTCSMVCCSQKMMFLESCCETERVLPMYAVITLSVVSSLSSARSAPAPSRAMRRWY